MRTVIAVCSRTTSGVPKFPVPEVSVGIYGIDGDFHASSINKHKKSGEEEPNTRHLTIVARESVKAVESELGIELPPGSLGENILVEGLGDLSQIKVGNVDRKSVVYGKSVDLGGRRSIKKKTRTTSKP